MCPHTTNSMKRRIERCFRHKYKWTTRHWWFCQETRQHIWLVIWPSNLLHCFFTMFFSTQYLIAKIKDDLMLWVLNLIFNHIQLHHGGKFNWNSERNTDLTYKLSVLIYFMICIILSMELLYDVYTSIC